MIYLLSSKSIVYNKNIECKTTSFINVKKIGIDKEIYYSFLFKSDNIDYLYYREGYSSCNQKLKRFIITNNLELVNDENYSLFLGNATHNFRFFRTIKGGSFDGSSNVNTVIGIGGQSGGYLNYCYTYKFYKKVMKPLPHYINYLKNGAKFISIKGLSIRDNIIGDSIYDNKHYCPYFQNGLYLFKFNNIDNNRYTIENNKLPILDGIKDGRHDGYYGFADKKNIKKSVGGLTVYDSNTSILFINNTYYLFQRANICAGCRYIQYSTSTDLISWGDWKLLELNPPINYFKNNIYINNFFKIKNITNYIGILQINETSPRSNRDVNVSGDIKLYYSDDCIIWDYVGNIKTYKHYVDWLISGEPLIRNNMMYFLINSNQGRDAKREAPSFVYSEISYITFYSIEKNRFSFIENKECNKISTFIVKLLVIKNNKIKLNFRTYKDGFLEVLILDQNRNIVINYSYDDFDTIYENRNEFNLPLSWNYNVNVDINIKVHIQIKGTNFKIYSIEL
jgi:hypothetical protein